MCVCVFVSERVCVCVFVCVWVSVWACEGFVRSPHVLFFSSMEHSERRWEGEEGGGGKWPPSLTSDPRGPYRRPLSLMTFELTWPAIAITCQVLTRILSRIPHSYADCQRIPYKTSELISNQLVIASRRKWLTSLHGTASKTSNNSKQLQ